MKTPCTFVFALTLHLALLLPLGADLHAQSDGEAGGGIKIYIIDDATGPELELKHGIKQLTVSDLEILINGVTQTRKPVQVSCSVVDDDAADNETVELAFTPFSGRKTPVAPGDNLPLREYQTASEVYRKDRNEWLLEMRDYRVGLMQKATTFIRGVSTLQTSVSTRFDSILESRNGVDFPRSDIVPMILAASKVLGTEGTRVLLINSDMVPATRKGKARTKPFQAAELDPGVHVVFCNVSKTPDASPLFQGLPNLVHHADHLTQAMELILKLDSTAPGAAQTAAAAPSK